MNLPDRSLMTPKRDFTIMRVLSKQTGQVIAIKDYRFNPELHEVLNGQPLNLAQPLPVEGVISTSPTTTTGTVVSPTVTIDEAVKSVEEEKPFVSSNGKRFRTQQGLKQYETKLAKGQVS